MPKNKKRADGRYVKQVYIGRGEDGRRQYKTVYGATQKEANDKALEVRIQLKKGIDVSAGRDTFEDWAKRWLSLKQREVSSKQLRCYQTSVRYLADGLGSLPIGKVRTADVQDVVLNLAEKNPHTGRPSSRRVLSDLRMTARQVFRFAIENRVLDYNPGDAVRLPANAPKTTRRALSDEEIGWIQETPHRARRAAMIMLYAGLRRGELIPLTWADIDLDGAAIRVCKSAEMVGGLPRVKPHTKTAAGMRTVNIPRILVDFLREEKAEEEREAGRRAEKVAALRPLVCPSASGGLMSDSAFDRLWESYMTELNLRHGDFRDLPKRPQSKFDPAGVPMRIERFTAHCLRHTFATLLYKAGVDVLTAKAQLGHADVKTTLQIYTHLDDQYQRSSMDRLDAYLRGEGDASRRSM